VLVLAVLVLAVLVLAVLVLAVLVLAVLVLAVLVLAVLVLAAFVLAAFVPAALVLAVSVLVLAVGWRNANEDGISDLDCGLNQGARFRSKASVAPNNTACQECVCARRCTTGRSRRNESRQT
jgi:hypothetical protein